MYNSYLEYVLDNPVNDNDFTKTAGFLDKLIGKGAKAVADKAVPASVAKEAPFVGPKIDRMKLIDRQHDIARKEYNARVNAARKEMLAQGDVVKPTVTRLSDGSRRLDYKNPYTKELSSIPEAEQLDYLAKSDAYKDLMSNKLRTLQHNTRERMVFDNPMGNNSNLLGRSRIFGITDSFARGGLRDGKDFSVLVRRPTRKPSGMDVITADRMKGLL